MCKSVCAPIWCCPVHEKIVRERLRGRIRRLFDVGAVIRVETRGTCDAILLGGPRWEKFSHHIITRNSLPQRGILPLPNKQMDAIAPRRRRIPSGAARERSPDAKDGAILVRTRTCTNYIQIHPPYKSFARLFQKPRSPVPPHPRVPRVTRSVNAAAGADRERWR